MADTGARVSTMEDRGFCITTRLNLELVCIAKTPARDRLNLWPPLPLVIRSPGYDQTNRYFSTESVDNIIAILERSDRVCQIELGSIRASRMEERFAAAQVPFPELTIYGSARSCLMK